MGKPFKMKGHTLPGINQRSEGDTDLSDGRSASSALQYTSPAKVTDKEKRANLLKAVPIAFPSVAALSSTSVCVCLGLVPCIDITLIRL